jgi:translation initiation factor eIF-2B subunit epsilon
MSNKKQGSSNDNNLKQEEKLQAIVLLDSYTNRFEPFSSSRAECLLPLAGGKTLLDASMEFLIENDVKEVVLFCTRHHSQIKSYIDSMSKIWHRHLEIHFLYSFKCQCLGDAMREIDAKGIVRSNFILLTASSVITNLKVGSYLETHKQTCKNDKNAVMTMMCINKLTDLSVHATQKDRSASQTSFVHNINNRIMHYEQQNSHTTKFVQLPTSLIEIAYNSTKQSANLNQKAVDEANAKFKLQNSSYSNNLTANSGFQGGSLDTILHLKTIQFRNDLLETQIYLCNPYVLHIFTDNFDYESMSEFIHGVLANEEVSGYTLYIDVFDRKYGSHFSMINNLNSYFYETMRLLQRSDLILDFDTTANYRRMLDRVHVYFSKMNLKFGNNCFFDRNVFIEQNCRLGENCELVNCYVGQNCVIGNNVKLSNCIIWPYTRIGNDSSLNAVILGSSVRIGNNCYICENTILANECALRDGTTVSERAVYVSVKSSQKKDHHHDHQSKGKYIFILKVIWKKRISISYFFSTQQFVAIFTGFCLIIGQNRIKNQKKVSFVVQKALKTQNSSKFKRNF